MWKDHLGMFSISTAMTRLGIVTAFCSVAACQMDDSANSVQQSTDQPTLLSGFDVAKFTPGVDCRDDLPLGKTTSLVNGYRTRLLGKVETRKQYGFDHYIYAIDSTKLDCWFYFANYIDGTVSVEANVLNSEEFYATRWFTRIEETLSNEEYKCLSLTFSDREASILKSEDDKEHATCVGAAAKRIGNFGIQGLMIGGGDFDEYMIIGGDVFLEG